VAADSTKHYFELVANSSGVRVLSLASRFAQEDNRMKSGRLYILKFFALLFLLPGLAGLIGSAMMSTRYLYTMPTLPDYDSGRIVPRGIHGQTIYQTAEEDRKLNLLEYSSVGVFVVGLVLSVVYLEKWSSAQVRAGDDERELAEHHAKI
jgi:hypothetical protein